ncbi:MAG: hypothetical protein HQK84_12805 [Nitrospinae bacterium]|nr:hypothetical protein [Nitrospinota bacterium]
MIFSNIIRLHFAVNCISCGSQKLPEGTESRFWHSISMEMVIKGIKRDILLVPFAIHGATNPPD